MTYIRQEDYDDIVQLFNAATGQIKELKSLLAQVPEYAYPEITCHTQLVIGKMYYLRNRTTYQSSIDRCKGDDLIKSTKGFYFRGNWNEDENTLTQRYQIFELKYPPK